MGKKKQDAVLREVFLEDIQIDIEMAWNGEIPPSLYHDRIQDLKSAMEKQLISERVRKFMRTFSRGNQQPGANYRSTICTAMC